MQNVILNLRNEIIRSISAIDAWFDKDTSLLDEAINTDETVAEFLYNLVTASRNLLDAITLNSAGPRVDGPVDLQFPHDSLAEYRGGTAVGTRSVSANLSNARADLREQLDRCLIYLEQLLTRQARTHKNFGEEDVEQYGGYQGIYLLLIHLKRNLGDLNRLEQQRQRQRN